MKKWIGVLVLVALGGGGYYGYTKFMQGASVAEPDVVKDLSSEEIRDGILSSDPKTRLDAVAQIEKLPEAERKAALLGALDAAYAPARLTAVAALARSFAQDADVVDRLLERAGGDPDDDVRQAAFGALKASADPRILTLSLKVLESGDESLAVRIQAARTLDSLTGRTTSKELAEVYDRAEMAADDLSMEWDDWLLEHMATLTWEPEQGRFVHGE